jgi:hypothetical protein
MPNEINLKLAEDTLADFRGAGYYADPGILAGYIENVAGLPNFDENRAIEVLRGLLRIYAQSGIDVKESFAGELNSLVQS